MSLPPLSLHRLDFSFSGKPLFEGLSLTLGEENPTAILGPSGCGKTTLLRLMAGLLKPRSGEIRLGLSPGEGPPGAFPVSFVFQEPRLLPWYRVLENVTLPLNRSLGACGTWGFLRSKAAKIPDFRAPADLGPMGVCKVENAQNCAFSLSCGLKPHRLLGACGTLAKNGINIQK